MSQGADRYPPLSSGPGRAAEDEADRRALAHLSESTELTPATTGLICDALLEWALAGRRWPQLPPQRPARRRHVEVLVEITERQVASVAVRSSVREKLIAARVAGRLQKAVAHELAGRAPGERATLDEEG